MMPTVSNNAITAPLLASWLASAAAKAEGDSSAMEETERPENSECNVTEMFR